MKYICWGEDKEDLTKKVDELREEDITACVSVDVSTKKNKSRGKRKWRVRVLCSKGHENIFEGEI